MKIAQSTNHKTGLFFGSFNPVHIGHMALANYFLEFTAIDNLQLILSPQNPLKEVSTLLSEKYRLAMLNIALSTYPELPVSINTIELELSKPSYTINTLTELQIHNPDVSYLILMGADSLSGIEKWKDYKKILSDYEICVYPRAGYNLHNLCDKYGTKAILAPEMEISSTFIRTAVKKGYNLSAYVPFGVWNYIKKNNLYSAIEN